MESVQDAIKNLTQRILAELISDYLELKVPPLSFLIVNTYNLEIQLRSYNRFIFICDISIINRNFSSFRCYQRNIACYLQDE